MKITKVKPKRRDESYYTPVRSILDDFFTFPMSRFGSFFDEPTVSPVAADIWEDKENIFVKMAMPGVKKEDIKISVMADSVSIEGKTSKKDEEKEDDRYWLRSMESQYQQTFNLPTNVDTDSVEAKLEDGVLTVTLPKAKEYRPKEIEIK